jgi:hypothetical protein
MAAAVIRQSFKKLKRKLYLFDISVLLQSPGRPCNATYQCGYNSICDYTSLLCQCAPGYYLNSSNSCGNLS